MIPAFLEALRPAVPLVSLWAHGSLAGGDYQEGRSDLDLIAVLSRPCTRAERTRLGELHAALGAPLLHCSYLPVEELADRSRKHLTWAHEELMRRPVTAVTRRELHAFGLVLHGPPPSDLLPAVSDAELVAFVRRDLGGFWRRSLEHPEWYLRDIWVDLGMLTLARATVTLRDQRLITKREALDVLAELGAPPEVISDIHARRYGTASPYDGADRDAWLSRRAELAIDFLRPAITHALAR